MVRSLTQCCIVCCCFFMSLSSSSIVCLPLLHRIRRSARRDDDDVCDGMLIEVVLVCSESKYLSSLSECWTLCELTTETEAKKEILLLSLLHILFLVLSKCSWRARFWAKFHLPLYLTLMGRRGCALLFLSSPSVAPCKSHHLHRALLLNCNFRTKDSLWI